MSNQTSKFKIGDRVKVIANTSGHNLDIGDIIVLEKTLRDNPQRNIINSSYYWFYIITLAYAYYITEDELELAETKLDKINKLVKLNN